MCNNNEIKRWEGRGGGKKKERAGGNEGSGPEMKAIERKTESLLV